MWHGGANRENESVQIVVKKKKGSFHGRGSLGSGQAWRQGDARGLSFVFVAGWYGSFQPPGLGGREERWGSEG